MKILVDMNLSPRWVTALQAAGIEARHWSTVGAPNVPDGDVLSWTAANGFVLLTHDLDIWRNPGYLGSQHSKRDSYQDGRPAHPSRGYRKESRVLAGRVAVG